jgi:hypothetical protein
MVADQIEALVVEALAKLVNDPSAQRKAVADYIADLEGRRATLEARLRPTDGEIAKQQQFIDDLTVELHRGRLSPERYEREVEAAEKERDSAQARHRSLAGVERELDVVQDSLAGIQAALTDGFKIDLGEEDVLAYDVEYTTERSSGHRATYKLATLMERLRLRIVVRRDGQVEISGFLQPTVVSAADVIRPGASRTSRRSASRCVS